MLRISVKHLFAWTLLPDDPMEHRANLVGAGEPDKAGGSLRTGTRPTLNLLLLLRIRRASVCASTLKTSHAPIGSSARSE